jgi:hypothetical protein
MTLSDSRFEPSPIATLETRSLPAAGLPRLPENTFPACRAHYPGGSRRVLMSVASLSRAAFPESQTGRHLQFHFRGLLRLHFRNQPAGSLNRPRRPLSQGSNPPGCPDTPLASYKIKPITIWVAPYLHWCSAPSGRTEISGARSA